MTPPGRYTSTLENGDSGKFTDTAELPDLLPANEMVVAVLDVHFNVTTRRPKTPI